MAKASLTLPNGTVVQIEGTVEEVQGLLTFYGSGAAMRGAARPENRAIGTRPKRRKPKSAPDPSTQAEDSGGTPNLSEIVNLAKNCDEAEDIERQILDRASQVDRTLLPLYIVHEHLENRFGLSSGAVSKITTGVFPYHSRTRPRHFPRRQQSM